ncbi:helix-turn-helix domain-containing protein [Gilvimarinus sp. SDUM040013]|uniref:RodZ family helix-turn-helix domain-containing protein n=1 Tax=Gilvimarinus gilvus TaxID=3058038 RepID=A0ABU4RZS2_9GAMM|nr:RodZ family helix-turn-helix domain-containing protein [Gilvimarinus sp. SDUM040013]MDO3385124.1 helix-turn-helix domain-containing protein [Gilvimarinus sp. SDUM040013]MDX6848499.1 RodZ family helix-turn-helix domain-containing protein [Gilvimarinus sp. SDUM040013]
MLESPHSSEQSLGKALAEARIRQGKSCEEVARALNIQPDKLKALEEDQYDKLFSPVFVRGYIRSYAKMCGVDSEPLIALYDANHDAAEDQPPLINDSLNVKMKNKRAKWPARVSLIVGIIACWALAYWYFGSAEPEPTAPASTEQEAQSEQSSAATSSVSQKRFSAAEEDDLAKPLRNDTEPAADGSPASKLPEESAVDQAQTSTMEEIQSPIETNVVESVEVAESQEPDATAQDSLVMHFTEDCWVSVADAAGDVIVAELRTAGTVLSLTGRGPFDITLGNAKAADVLVNSLPVAIPNSGNDNVVHFSTDRTL